VATEDGLSTSTKVTSTGVIASIQQHGHTTARRGAQMGEDQWARWLLRDRSGGDQTQLAAAMRILLPVRDRVLRGAKVAPGDTVLDLGTGDGLIGFGALPLVGEHGIVIFSEVSEELLGRCRALADEQGVLSHCRFVQAAAQDLGPIADGSVDVVTTRSVLIYVADKQRAFQEAFRVLRPGGRLAYGARLPAGNQA
jgi:arsenite methyltransferase